MLCLGLVWTCNRSITLHHTGSRTQQPLERKDTEKTEGGKGSDRQRQRAVPQERGGITRAGSRGIHLSRGGRGPPHLIRLVAGGDPAWPGRQQGLCSWDWWRWQWSSSAPWVTVILSSFPRREGRDGVSSVLLSLFLSVVFFFSLFSAAAFRFCGLSHTG